MSGYAPQRRQPAAHEHAVGVVVLRLLDGVVDAGGVDAGGLRGHLVLALVVDPDGDAAPAGPVDQKAVAAMQAVRASLDPKRIMNPRVLF